VTSSTLYFLADLVLPIAFGAFIVASLVLIVWSARRHRETPVAGGLPGLFPAGIAGVVVSAPLIAVNVFLSSYYSPETSPLEIAVFTFVLFAGPVALSVLDVFAIWPPTRRTVGGAVGRAVGGVVLAIALTMIFTKINSTVSAAAFDKHMDEARSAVAARSAGLSMEVVVVGVKLGAANENGRLVDNITIDLTIRSADEIQLREAHPDQSSFNQQTRIGPAAFAAFDVSPRLHLPTLIPAGFEQTYRLTASLSAADWREEYVAGPWEARVQLFGPLDEMNLTIDYSVTTTFTVSDAP